jgi:threonyl-tRNA synthetase
VLPIADRHNGYAQAIATALRGYEDKDAEVGEDSLAFPPVTAKPGQSLRVMVDDRRETLGKKIRENQRMKVPYMLIVGDNDIEAGTVGVRSREDGDLGAKTLAEFLRLLEG